MHYRIQLPLFSPCLIKLHPTKLQLKKKNQKKELMVLIPSLSSCCFKMMLFTVQKKYLSLSTPTNAVIVRSTACFQWVQAGPRVSAASHFRLILISILHLDCCVSFTSKMQSHGLRVFNVIERYLQNSDSDFQNHRQDREIQHLL